MPSGNTVDAFVAGGINRDKLGRIEQTIRRAGKETLYKRGKMLIATNAMDIDPDKDKDKITEIERFGDEYFKLVAANSKAENEMLANQSEGEELIVRLRGKAYRIK